VAQHGLGEVHQVAVRPVGRVELHHRELGVVADADALVAEVAVDLEHALEAAHQQPLQVQLGRDAQEHLLVQRVVVGDEGLGVGAARDGVQHRRLHLQEAVLDHEAADRADRLAARHEARARGILVGDQVDVALAVLLLLVGHAVELVGQRAQALGQQAHRRWP
jgi:ribosomal protein L7/L12